MDGVDGGVRVLYLGPEDHPLRDSLQDFDDLQTTTSLADALASLDSVDCVVVTDALDDVSPVECTNSIRDQEPDLPIIVAATDGGESLAAAVTAAGATGYVPAEDFEALHEQVDRVAVTYRRRRRQRWNSQVLQSIIDQFTVPVFVKDEEARILMTSDPGGYSHDEVIGMTDLDLYSGDDPSHARRAYEDDLQVIETGEPIHEQIERIDADEFDAWIKTTKVPWRDESGEIKGLVGISRDITEYKEYEHQLERERARSERFANYIAHDLRNPLNVARGYLELAQDMDDTEPLDDVDQALDRIEEVINDVLSLVGGDRNELPIEKVKLNEPIQNAWETVDTADATLTADIPSETRIAAGRSHMQELFENLIRNSVEHGGESVSINVGLLHDGFYLEDDGRGISADLRENVLEYGFTTREGGTGIGLAVVSELTDVYNWDVDVTEGPTGGARFEFHQCLLVPDPPDADEPKQPIELESNVDVGEATPPGSVDSAEDTCLVRGAGQDIWSDIDDFHFVYAPLPAGGGIAAQIVDLDEIHEYTKAGVMIRDEPETGSVLGHIGITASHGSEVLWRPESSDRTANIPIDRVEQMPLWFRIERRADQVTAWLSAEGDSWVPIDQRRIDIEGTAYAGLVVCSHEQGSLAEARFEDVEAYELTDQLD